MRDTTFVVGNWMADVLGNKGNNNNIQVFNKPNDTSNSSINNSFTN